MKRVRQADVAERAGVSVAAVSFALNGKPGVSDETKQAILRAMEELGYTPPSAARVKPKQGTKNILFLNGSRTAITSDIFPETPYFSELLRAFESKLSDHGYDFRIKSLHIDKDFQSEIKALFRQSEADGVLLVATDMLEADVRAVQQVEPRLVVLDSFFDSLNINCVVMDNHLGGVLAARHLVERGHTRIGYVQSRIRIVNFEQRKQAFLSELARHGLRLDAADVLPVDATVDASAEQLTGILRSRRERPTAYFAENDYLAIGMLRALSNLGVAVPDEVAVVGFDNIGMAGIVTPTLTTINVPKGKLADCCLSQLKFILSHDAYWGIKQLVSVDLVERQSTMGRPL